MKYDNPNNQVKHNKSSKLLFVVKLVVYTVIVISLTIIGEHYINEPEEDECIEYIRVVDDLTQTVGNINKELIDLDRRVQVFLSNK